MGFIKFWKKTLCVVPVGGVAVDVAVCVSAAAGGAVVAVVVDEVVDGGSCVGDAASAGGNVFLRNLAISASTSLFA